MNKLGKESWTNRIVIRREGSTRLGFSGDVPQSSRHPSERKMRGGANALDPMEHPDPEARREFLEVH